MRRFWQQGSLPSVRIRTGLRGADFALLAARLEAHGKVEHNRFLLRAHVRDSAGPIDLTVFANGRAIIKGTSRPEVARGIYAKYVGS